MNPTGKQSPSERGTDPRGRFVAYDFFVDFLGGLVPGLLFLLGVLAALGAVTHAIFWISFGVSTHSLVDLFFRFLQATQGTPSAIWIGSFFILVTISYVVGHFFYRLGPKKPNQKSFLRISRTRRLDIFLRKLMFLKRAPLVGRLKYFQEPLSRAHLRTEFACTSSEECEFPFPHLYDYLKQRGHNHLLPFVRWRQGELGFRSKTYINLLKIRLRYLYPEKCGVIIRNEAHVRLASSAWYVARALRSWTLFAAGLLLLAILFAPWAPAGFHQATALSQVIPAIGVLVFVLILAEYGRKKVESFLHYQRLREVFYVLETAFIAARTSSIVLDPPFPAEELGSLPQAESPPGETL